LARFTSAVRVLRHPSRILSCCRHSLREDPGELLCFLQQLWVVCDSAVTEIDQPIDAFVDFLEHHSELRLKFPTRATSSCSSVVGANRAGRPSQLRAGFLRFGSAWQATTELDDAKGEHACALDEIAVRHTPPRSHVACRDEKRTISVARGQQVALFATLKVKYLSLLSLLSLLPLLPLHSQFFHLSANPVGHLEQHHVVPACPEHRAGVAARREHAWIGEVLLLPRPHDVEVGARSELPAEHRVHAE
jgi:hypothetical protein